MKRTRMPVNLQYLQMTLLRKQVEGLVQEGECSLKVNKKRKLAEAEYDEKLMAKRNE